MSLLRMIEKIRARPDIDQAGMILCHNGIVRSTSRDGRTIKGIELKADRSQLALVLEDAKNYQGIIEILAEIKEGTLYVGEDIMWVVVAGDTRDHVFPVLQGTVERIKREVVQKVEF